MSGYRSGTSIGRLVTKQNTAGQFLVEPAVFTGTGAGITTAWTQVTGAATSDLLITQIAATCPTAATSAGGFAYLEIGIGASGSESVICLAILNDTQTASAFRAVQNLAVPNRVAAGQRIAVRFTSPTSFSGSSITVWLTGVPYANVEGN
jgi:hypothetical protein